VLRRAHHITNSFRLPNDLLLTALRYPIKLTSTDLPHAALFAADALNRHPALAKNCNEQPFYEGFT